MCEQTGGDRKQKWATVFALGQREKRGIKPDRAACPVPDRGGKKKISEYY